MMYFRATFDLRRKILKVGAPALVSRGTMAVWGVLHIFIIRTIPEEAFAAYALARTFETFGVLIGGGFIQQAILKMASEGEGRREHELANAGIFLTLLLAVLAGLLLLGLGGVADRFYSGLDLSGLPVLLAGVVLTGALGGVPRALLITRQKTRDVMFTDLLQFTVRGAIIGVLILAGHLRSGHQIFTATIIANLCSFALSLALSGRFSYRDASLRKHRVTEVMNFSLICLGTATANYIYTSTDIIMLGKIAPGDVAAYGAARSLSGVFAMVNAAANMVLLPLFSRMWRQGQKNLIVGRAWSSVLIAELILLPAFAALTFFPARVLDIVYSGRYTDSWPVTMLLGALIIVRPVGSYFSTAALAVGKPQFSLYSVLISSAVNVGLNFLLIHEYGGLGAAAATGVALTLSTVWIVWKTTRFIRAREVPE
jgi:O-antigen/teichoic acid export membrane protein